MLGKIVFDFLAGKRNGCFLGELIFDVVLYLAPPHHAAERRPAPTRP